MEFSVGFGRKANDDIGAERDIRDDLAKQGDFFKVLLFRVDPVHLFEDSRRARLERKVDELAEGGEVADCVHQLDGNVNWVGRHKADPLHAGDCV